MGDLDKIYQGDPPTESRGAERTPLLSKSLLRDKMQLVPTLPPDLVYGLCLKNYIGAIEPLYYFVLQE